MARLSAAGRLRPDEKQHDVERPTESGPPGVSQPTAGCADRSLNLRGQGPQQTGVCRGAGVGARLRRPSCPSARSRCRSRSSGCRCCLGQPFRVRAGPGGQLGLGDGHGSSLMGDRHLQPHAVECRAAGAGELECWRRPDKGCALGGQWPGLSAWVSMSSFCMGRTMRYLRVLRRPPG